MHVQNLKKILQDVADAVAQAMLIDRIVNVCAIAEAVRMRNKSANIAREDIEAMVMEAAQLHAAPMEFGPKDKMSGCILEIIPATDRAPAAQ